ncbi:TetR/AcrR family transcriptional regulator C-terminal domain-containing protein [Actinoalloteichus fjordicus]|uniref:Transcriptional regulator, TetR family n=1 Tax=Actinoalloteichus fjordicus TaxID=1612552 RepID=A0AAC9LCC5_9PSEU|nr:TetR/AcrR family transcriptional regulator C-terminal domain-containing protein [Actinoalloteichus fjordicus]APU14319.1 transcriptional regulator, TetR family [Actinoalloteichus fjordicus]
MDTNATAGLSQALTMLWKGEAAGREAPRRNTRPGLSLEAVVTAAVEIADAEGLAGLSMAAVAHRLGFTTMSLYRYVSSKDVLLVLMHDKATAMTAASPAPPSSSGWRGRLESWTRDQVTMYVRHPWLSDMKITGPPLTPASLDWMERGLAAMQDTGLDETEKLGVIATITGYVRHEAAFAKDLSRPDPQQSSADGYGQTLARLVDPATHPALSALISDGVFDNEPPDSQAADYLAEDFEFGLELILSGIATLIEQRGRAS